MELDHSKCRVSTGIDDRLTAGQGKLDDMGFWEFPCEPCRARAQGQWNVAERLLIAGGERDA